MKQTSSSNGALAIETRNLAKHYGGLIAVRDLTLEVERGEVFGFLGPNGAGKSTAVKMLTGLVRPTSGIARVLGQPISDRRTKSRIGYLPELFRFHDWLTAREFLNVHGQLYRMDADERRRRVDEVLHLVGLESRADERLSHFSKGMQQRAGLAQALLHRPVVVFLDEPTSALDPIGRRLVRDIIRELRRDGTTVFLNSHLLTEVEQVCDRVAILNRGHVVATGTPEDLLAGEMRLTLRVNAWTDSIQEKISGLARVANPADRAADGTVNVTLVLVESERIPELVRTLVELGVDLYEVTPQRMALEDLFVGLVDQSEGIELRT